MASSMLTPFPEKLSAASPLAPFHATGVKAVVVGGTNGIGFAIASSLSAAGAQVTVVGRTNRAENSEKNISFVKADLSSMKAAKQCADALPAQAIDLLIFTQGIITKKTRHETEEGIEEDMAVSALSRLVMLRQLAPKMHARARVFIMGFPGTKEALPDASDLNAEKKYSQFPQHMATVVVNEALVLDGATRYPMLAVFGLNPGLIRTGIRANVVGTGLFAKMVEGCIGCLNVSAEDYAKTICPVLLAPGLDHESGFHFSQSGKPVKPSANLTPEAVNKLVTAAEELVATHTSY